MHDVIIVGTRVAGAAQFNPFRFMLWSPLI